MVTEKQSGKSKLAVSKAVYDNRCFEGETTSVTTAEFYSAFILSNIRLPVNFAVVNSLIICLEQFVFSWSGEKFACLHELQFGRISLNIYFRISIKTKKLPAGVLNSLFNDLISYQMWPGLFNNHAAYRDIPVNEQCYV